MEEAYAIKYDENQEKKNVFTQYDAYGFRNSKARDLNLYND